MRKEHDGKAKNKRKKNDDNEKNRRKKIDDNEKNKMKKNDHNKKNRKKFLHKFMTVSSTILPVTFSMTFVTFPPSFSFCFPSRLSVH